MLMAGNERPLSCIELPIKVIVFKNNSLAMDRFEQEEMGYKPLFTAMPAASSIDFAKVAEACGARGLSLLKPRRACLRALKQALASKRPAVIEVSVDPDEPPLPPDKVKA